MPSKFIIITSINGITSAVKAFSKLHDWHVIVVGDKKTPPLRKNPFPNITFLSVDDQKKLKFSFHDVCPFNHYVRKNLGYLYAIQQGATWITDSDDDNFPYENWASDINETASIETLSGAKVVNIYRYFTNQFIWPRGFPLNSILGSIRPKINHAKQNKIAVWQGLVDKDPDVDAIYRLIINKPITFKKRPPLALEPGTYCPLNSQNTIWTLKACFPYLYLPISVTFRFCDILRGYIAQRGIWAMRAKLAFTSASAYQERNAHNFMDDFIDEIPCYKQIGQVIDLLDTIKLGGNPSEDIVFVYKRLQKLGIVNQNDLLGVQAFVHDMQHL